MSHNSLRSLVLLVKFEWNHRNGGGGWLQLQLGYVKIRDFQPMSCCISETEHDKDIVTIED